MIKVLLKHSADVNRTYGGNHFGGALDYAVYKAHGTNEVSTRVDPEIFQMLLDAGGDLSRSTLANLIKCRDGECVSLLMSANAHKSIAKWLEWETFVDVVIFQDDRTALTVIRIMLDNHADLNFGVQKHTYSSEIYPSTVIDAAARRGNPEMVEILLRFGALVTHKTLQLAIMGGNHDLIRLLLDRGADVNSCSSYGLFSPRNVTPLSEAIRLKSDEIISLLEQHGAFRFHDRVQFSAALNAASETGNMPIIKRLVQLGGQTRVPELGCALAIAIIEGHDEAVTMLIHAGANLDQCVDTNQQFLVQALTRRNAGLVHSLLEAGVDPSANTQVLLIAVEWGDYSIVETLILAGAFPVRREPLVVALKRQDHALVKLLLDNGADINDSKLLEIATGNEDFSMASHLLDRGADPVDSKALGEAMVRNPQFFDVLLEKHRTRYSMIQANFGHHALIQAIKLRDEQAIRLILGKGINANSLIRSSFSPFGHAIFISTLEVIEIFLQNGCKPNSIVVQDSNHERHDPLRGYGIGMVRYRMTGFLAAIATQNVSKVKLLHKYGADVNFPAHTRIKRTPLQQAAGMGSTDIVELLIRLGAEVNTPAARRDGGTALQLAAIGGYIPIVCLLLNSQADVNAPASKVNGRTALEGAAEHGRLDMVQLLLNAGAGNEGKDHGQFERAKALANDEGHNHITDFLEDYLQQRRPRVEPATPGDLGNDDLGIGNFGEGIEGIDMTPMVGWLEEDTFLSDHWYEAGNDTDLPRNAIAR